MGHLAVRRKQVVAMVARLLCTHCWVSILLLVFVGWKQIRRTHASGYRLGRAASACVLSPPLGLTFARLLTHQLSLFFSKCSSGAGLRLAPHLDFIRHHRSAYCPLPQERGDSDSSYPVQETPCIPHLCLCTSLTVPKSSLTPSLQ